MTTHTLHITSINTPNILNKIAIVIRRRFLKLKKLTVEVSKDQKTIEAQIEFETEETLDLQKVQKSFEKLVEVIKTVKL